MLLICRSILLHNKAVQGFPRVPAKRIDVKSARAGLVDGLLVRIVDWVVGVEPLGLKSLDAAKFNRMRLLSSHSALQTAPCHCSQCHCPVLVCDCDISAKYRNEFSAPSAVIC